MIGSLLYPVAAAASTVAASAYVWYQRPGIPMKWMLRLALYNSGLRVKYIQGSHYNFCYCERGTKRSGSPTILFVHGFGASKDMWVGVVKKLPEAAHMIIVDLPGHGDTTPMPQGEGDDISIRHMVHALHDFVHTLDLDEPFHIIGTSMGGAIAALYTSLYGEDVSLLTLSCPAVLPNPPVKTNFFQELEEGGGNKYLIPHSPDDVRSMLQHLMYCQDKVPQNNQVLKGILQIREPKLPFQSKLFSALREERNKNDDIPDLLRNIKVPTQIVWGKEDKLLHYSGADALQKLIPTCARVDILENCGHTIGWDRPGLFVKHVLGFRGELSSFKKSE